MTLTFGGIFRFAENDYVFLAEAEDVIYAARILELTETKRLTSLFDKRVKQNTVNLNRIAIFTFVELKTKEYFGRAALLHKTGQSIGIQIQSLNIRLCDEDLKNIKQEILESKTVPTRLVEIVRKVPV